MFSLQKVTVSRGKVENEVCTFPSLISQKHSLLIAGLYPLCVQTRKWDYTIYCFAT